MGRLGIDGEGCEKDFEEQGTRRGHKRGTRQGDEPKAPLEQIVMSNDSFWDYDPCVRVSEVGPTRVHTCNHGVEHPSSLFSAEIARPKDEF